MKSTGAGAFGNVLSSSPLSSSVRFPLRRLQGAHEVTTFSQTESPPFDLGTTWSSVRRPAVVTRNAYVGDEPDHVRPRKRVGRRMEPFLELLDHLGLALEHEHVGTPNGRDVQWLVARIEDENLLHLGRNVAEGVRSGSKRARAPRQ